MPFCIPCKHCSQYHRNAAVDAPRILRIFLGSECHLPGLPISVLSHRRSIAPGPTISTISSGSQVFVLPSRESDLPDPQEPTFPIHRRNAFNSADVNLPAHPHTETTNMKLLSSTTSIFSHHRHRTLDMTHSNLLSSRTNFKKQTQILP